MPRAYSDADIGMEVPTSMPRSHSENDLLASKPAPPASDIPVPKPRPRKDIPSPEESTQVPIPRSRSNDSQLSNGSSMDVHSDEPKMSPPPIPTARPVGVTDAPPVPAPRRDIKSMIVPDSDAPAPPPRKGAPPPLPSRPVSMPVSYNGSPPIPDSPPPSPPAGFSPVEHDVDFTGYMNDDMEGPAVPLRPQAGPPLPARPPPQPPVPPRKDIN